jgi:hypothetical protein
MMIAPPFSTMKGWVLPIARRIALTSVRVLLVQKISGIFCLRSCSSAWEAPTHEYEF